MFHERWALQAGTYILAVFLIYYVFFYSRISSLTLTEQLNDFA